MTICPTQATKDILFKLPGLKPVIKTITWPIRQAIEKKSVRQYNSWLRKYLLSSSEVIRQSHRSKLFTYRPLISIVVPVYKPPAEFFIKMLESVFEQTYDNWELILVDDASPGDHTKKIIKEWEVKDTRIKHLFLTKNNHIAGATNRGIEIATGEFVALLDHDDILVENALYEVVSILNSDHKINFIYTDEDKITEQGVRHQPFLKPDWNQDLLYSVNYITHFSVVRKSILDHVGYERDNYNGAQDWELFLRITRSIAPETIYHIPKILYSWRVHAMSTAKSFDAKPYVVDAQRHSIQSDLIAKKESQFSINRDALYAGQWQVQFMPEEPSTITIFISSSLDYQVVAQHIKQNTDCQHYETRQWNREQSIGDIIKNKRVGDYVVFVETDLSIKHTNWLQHMLGDARRGGIGFVVAAYEESSVMKHLVSILGKERARFVNDVSRRHLVKHIYLTTKYNVDSFEPGVCMINRLRLQEVIGGQRIRSISRVGSDAPKRGYRNLYNPYIKVVK